MNVIETDLQITRRIFADIHEQENGMSVWTLEPPVLDRDLHSWGTSFRQILPNFELQIATHIRSKPDRENIGCGDHCGAFGITIPQIGILIGIHGDDSLGVAWPEGWQIKVKQLYSRLTEILPEASWKNPDVVHANEVRGFTDSREFSQFAGNARFRLSDAINAEIESRPVFQHPFPIIEKIMDDIQYDFIRQKSRFLQKALYDKISFLAQDNRKFLKWYFNSIFGNVFMFIPDSTGSNRFDENPLVFASKLHSKADYHADYEPKTYYYSTDEEDYPYPDPNRLVEELTRRLGVKGEEREKIRLEKPDNVYSTYRINDSDLSYLKHFLVNGTTMTTDLIPSNVPVLGFLISDGIGQPETSSDRYEKVGDTEHFQDAVNTVNQLPADEADAHFTQLGYNGDDRSIITVSLTPK